MSMDERKFRILQAIIDDYILTAIPVGSRTISKKYDMGLSSATIRNEMSDLEELGYLDQPHVSAGRIPSAKAYRLYVDQLLGKGKIASSDVEAIKAHLGDRAKQMEEVIHNAAQVLSELTHYTALVMTPKEAEMRLRNIQLVPVNAQHALVVIVTDSGIIRDQVIATGADMDSDTLYSISRFLTERLSGHTLSEAKLLLRDASHAGGQEKLMAEITSLITGVSQTEKSGKLALGGTSNILDYPEYSDVEKAKSFLSLLESKDDLIKVLQQHQQMAFTVRIGPETGIPELKDCSLVTASYRLGDNTRGMIGVIGPTRMRYGQVFSILGALGQQLSQLFNYDEE